MTIQLDTAAPGPAGRSAAVLLDVGYFLIQGAQALTGQQQVSRNNITLADGGKTLLAEIEAEVDNLHLELLRIYWYDGALNGLPDSAQKILGLDRRVKLRLGNVVGSRQKGVDKRISKDLLALASSRAVTDIVLVSGDQDVAEEFDQAGQHGIVMHLWGISGYQGTTSQSNLLYQSADEFQTFDAAWIGRVAVLVESDNKSVVTSSEPKDPAAEGVTTTPAQEIAGTTAMEEDEGFAVVAVDKPSIGSLALQPSTTSAVMQGEAEIEAPAAISNSLDRMRRSLGIRATISAQAHSVADRAQYQSAGHAAFAMLFAKYGAQLCEALEPTRTRRTIPEPYATELLAFAEKELERPVRTEIAVREEVWHGFWGGFNSLGPMPGPSL